MFCVGGRLSCWQQRASRWCQRMVELALILSHLVERKTERTYSLRQTARAFHALLNLGVTAGRALERGGANGDDHLEDGCPNIHLRRAGCTRGTSLRYRVAATCL